MKNTCKVALILFFISALVESCCKKEKCPKLTDEMKFFLPYKTGDKLYFVSKNYRLNTKDTVEGIINKVITEKNYPCSSSPKQAGKCDIASSFFLDFVHNINSSIYLPKEETVEFTLSYRFLNSKNEFLYNLVYSEVLKTPLSVNGINYYNVKKDSIEFAEQDLNSNYKTVIFHNKNQGVLMLRKYLNDKLYIEMIKL